MEIKCLNKYTGEIKCSKKCFSSGRYDKKLYTKDWGMICKHCGASMVEIKRRKSRRTLLGSITMVNGKIIKIYN